MAHEIKIYGALCSTEIFTVNGKDADSEDFGNQDDKGVVLSEYYSCGNMQFETRSPTKEVLDKYGIDELEYWTIANNLSEGLSFGSCGLCV